MRKFQSLMVLLFFVGSIEAFCPGFPFCGGNGHDFANSMSSLGQQIANFNFMKFNEEMLQFKNRMNTSMVKLHDSLEKQNKLTVADITMRVKVENTTFSFGGCFCVNVTCTCCRLPVNETKAVCYELRKLELGFQVLEQDKTVLKLEPSKLKLCLFLIITLPNY